MAAADAGGTWRDGTVLVLSREAGSLPNRCVRCNQPADEPTKTRKVYWHNPWLYLLLFNLIIYAVVAAIVRKKALVAPGLCSAHKRRHRIGIAISWTLLLGSFAIMIVAGATNNGLGVAGGMLILLVALLVSVSATRILRPKRIDAQYVRLKGCGSAFLDSMPQFPG